MKALLVAAGVATVALTSGPVDARDGPMAIDNNKDGFTGGVYAGYDHHLTEKVVIGVEGGFDLRADDRTLSRSGSTSIDPRYS